MKKTTIISLVIIGVIAAAVIFVLVTKEADAPAAEKTEQSAQSEPIGEEENTSQDSAPTTSKKGQYTEYSQAKLASSKSENYLFFHAPWCPQCRAIESSINAGGHIPDNVTIFKIDYDSNQELRKKYGVTLQTTFVEVDSEGNFIDKYVAYDNPSIDSVVENFIDK